MNRSNGLILGLAAFVAISGGTASGPESDPDIASSPPAEYELYFRSLSPEDQARELATQFPEPDGQVAPLGVQIANSVLSAETGLEAMPYLREEYSRLRFDHCTGDWWTNLCDYSPMRLLNLVSSMVWLSSFPENAGIVLRPADEDAQWFAKETESKIREYIQAYLRLDSSMIEAERAVVIMTDRERATRYWDDNPVLHAYNKYVRGNAELEKTVGLPSNLVFNGYDGPVLEPEGQ